MVSGTLTQSHRHGGRWYDAGDKLTLDDDTAALLVSVGKFTPDETGGEAEPQLGAVLETARPQIPQQRKRKIGIFSND